MAAFGAAQDDATLDSVFTDESDEDEITREFGLARCRSTGAQGDGYTPVELRTRYG